MILDWRNSLMLGFIAHAESKGNQPSGGPRGMGFHSVRKFLTVSSCA